MGCFGGCFLAIRKSVSTQKTRFKHILVLLLQLLGKTQRISNFIRKNADNTMQHHGNGNAVIFIRIKTCSMRQIALASKSRVGDDQKYRD